MSDFPSVFGFLSRRTNFLSVGVRLCWIIAGICALPLAFVVPWIAVWLMVLMTIIVLGTFGIWAFHAVKNPQLLDSEEHTEQMGAISVFGQNTGSDEPITLSVDAASPKENPKLRQADQIVGPKASDDA